MNKYHFSKLERVSKTRAKQLYNNGFSVLFIPCKLNPENNFYNLGIWENIFLQGQYNSFEELENAFTFYNCNAETGKYIAFYVSTEKTYIHFTFFDSSNPYIFRGSPLDCLQELKKWGKYWKIEAEKEHFYYLSKEV
ncbi:Uncharacterised protein [uncultured Eubacterium sp.]|nr:Uncharacterised protein [uncultured Eubacterium sp.]